MTSKFKPGDRVSVVHGTAKLKGRLSVSVIGPEFWNVTDYYKTHGPFHERQLRLLKPPKPKTVTKTREVWVNVYPQAQFIYSSKAGADRNAGMGTIAPIACIPVTLTWEEEC